MARKYALIVILFVLISCSSQTVVEETTTTEELTTEVTSEFPITELKKDIPWFKQISSGNCVQTNVKMALKYYYPDKDFSFELLDELSGRDGDEWTWTTQVMPILVDNKLDAYYYSTTPYRDIVEGGVVFVTDYYGEDIAEVIIEHTDWEALEKSVSFIDNENRFFNEKKDWDFVEKEFFDGSYIILIIDKNVLIESNGKFSGHAVSITSINKTHALINDPADNKDVLYEKEKLVNAWNAKGTDNDVVVIKGIS